MQNIITNELAYGSRRVRAMVDEKGLLFFCAYDLACCLKRPQYLATNPIFTMAPRSRKAKFSPEGDFIWAIHQSEVEKYFASMKNESSVANKNYKELVAWVNGLTVNNIAGPIFKIENVEIEQTDGGVLTSASANRSQSVVPYLYGNAPVTFEVRQNEVLINATEMGKAFGKSPTHWLRNAGAKDFLDKLCAMRNRNASDLVVVVNGDGGGTWMHEDVALEFARWLDPGFAIWCNDHIKELMKHGVTATEHTIETILSDPSSVIKILQALQQEREEKALAILERDQARSIVAVQEPKVKYYDVVIDKRDYFTTNQLAGELGMSYPTLRTRLYNMGIITKKNGPIKLGDKFRSWAIMVQDFGPRKKEVLKWTREGRKHVLAAINPLIPTISNS